MQCRNHALAMPSAENPETVVLPRSFGCAIVLHFSSSSAISRRSIAINGGAALICSVGGTNFSSKTKLSRALPAHPAERQRDQAFGIFAGHQQPNILASQLDEFHVAAGVLIRQRTFFSDVTDWHGRAPLPIARSWLLRRAAPERREKNPGCPAWAGTDPRPGAAAATHRIPACGKADRRKTGRVREPRESVPLCRASASSS